MQRPAVGGKEISMEKTRKTYLLLISFAIGLVLVVVHFETIISGIGFSSGC